MKRHVRKGIKFCIDCKHHSIQSKDGERVHSCDCWARQEVNPVTGETETVRRTCHEMRSSKGLCKLRGILYEPRD